MDREGKLSPVRVGAWRSPIGGGGSDSMLHTRRNVPSDVVEAVSTLALRIGDAPNCDEDPSIDADIDNFCATYGERLEAICTEALLSSDGGAAAVHGRRSVDISEMMRRESSEELISIFVAAAEGTPGSLQAAALLPRRAESPPSLPGSAKSYRKAKKSNGLAQSPTMPMPNRVSTALCCHVLGRVARKMRHFVHIRDVRRELIRSIYKEAANVRSVEEIDEKFGSLQSLLHATPYFEVVRSLKRRVDKLLSERQHFDRARSNAKQRRLMRKQVLMRTSKNWQNMLLNSAFRQWRETARNTIRQREMLARYFRRLKAVTLPEIFRAWKATAVGDKLKRTEAAKNSRQEELNLLEQRLREAKKTEGDLMLEMVRMEKETKALRARLTQTNEAIAAQRVPEVREVISATGKSLIGMCDTGLKNIELVLKEISRAPDAQLLAHMYFVEEEEASKSQRAPRKGKPIETKEGKTDDGISSDGLPELSQEKVQEALRNLPSLAADRLLLRWVKYRLRLSQGAMGFRFKRKVENFTEDLRDGVVYSQIMNRLSSRRNRAKLEKEIDPQRRCEIVLAQAGRLNPPATGFITVGHILGADAALNVAFVARLFNTHNRLERGKGRDSAVHEELHDLRQRWVSKREFVEQLIDPSKWSILRAATDDATLEKMLAELQQLSEDIASLGKSLEPMQASALQTLQVGWSLRHNVSNLMWQVFAHKTLQEEKEFAVVDLRKERLVQQYTKLGSDGELRVLIKSGAGAQKLQSLTKVDHDVIRSEMEAILEDNFADLVKIFQHYSAGDDGGNATSMSLSEFWEIVKDCSLCKSSGTGEFAASGLRKDTINKVFARADALEAEEARTLVAQAKAKGEEVSKVPVLEADAEITPDGFINALIEISFRKFKNIENLAKRFQRLLTKYILPKACRSNTETFRKEISQDDVQAVFRKWSSKLRQIFEYYAAATSRRLKKARKSGGTASASAPPELGIDAESWMKLMRDCKLITRPSDMRHDFAEESAKKIFVNVQAGGGDGNETVGGGDELMIYLEFLEALAAVACYKHVNPYIPFATRLELCFKENIVDVALKVLRGRKK